MVVIICGLPGSGKSYFASQLASVIRAEYINSDKVRKDLGASGKYSLDDKLAIYREMVKMSREFLKKNKSIVVDATFYRDSMREMFQSEAKQLGSDIYFIHVHADESLVRERMTKPRADSEADYKVYLYIRDQFEEINVPHLKLESTNGNLTSMLDKAVTYINGVV
ncbi:MAG: hypothetical protein C0490_17090 [Marivirga sp.]|nr:hypothetical protein [Marivirga sp.]